MADSYVLLWLEAPLQSWGYESRFNRRETLGFPTRSGVLGLILCAMGVGGPQSEWLEKMSRYGQTVLAFGKKEPSRKFREICSWWISRWSGAHMTIPIPGKRF